MFFNTFHMNYVTVKRYRETYETMAEMAGRRRRNLTSLTITIVLGSSHWPPLMIGMPRGGVRRRHGAL